MTVRLGTMLYGYCGGYFGRDEYGPNRVEVVGADYVVARNDRGRPVFAAVAPEDLEEFATPEEAERWEQGVEA
jgi:hypothetical protein